MAEYPQKTYIGTREQLNGIAPAPGNFKINRDTGEASFETDAHGNKVTISAAPACTVYP